MDTSNSGSKPKKREKFSWPGGPSIKQIFSIPDTTAYYLATNSSSPEVYLKLAKSCKYFFENNPLLVVQWMNNFRICAENKEEWESINIDLSKLSSKIWLTDQLEYYDDDDTNFAALIAQKFYKCENALLSVMAQKIDFDNFKLLAPFFQEFLFDHSLMFDSDGNVVMLEKILESIPNIKRFEYQFSSMTPTAPASTMKNILKLKNLDNLEVFELFNIPGVFDVQDLAEFIKNQKNTKIWVDFSSYISSEMYKKQLDKLIDDIIDSERSYCVITYRGQNYEKSDIMVSRYPDPDQ